MDSSPAHESESEFGLASPSPSLESGRTIQKLSGFVDKVCCFLGVICGDKCRSAVGSCECGDSTITNDDNEFCCTPMNETCMVQGMF